MSTRQRDRTIGGSSMGILEFLLIIVVIVIVELTVTIGILYMSPFQVLIIFAMTLFFLVMIRRWRTE